MNRQLIADYINLQPIKIVKTLDFEKNKITYEGVHLMRTINTIGDEELVRAYLLTKLCNELGYKAEDIELECEFTAGRPHTNVSRIDIIVRDKNGNAFLFIELKSPSDYAKIDKDHYIEEQLFKVAGMAKNDGYGVKYLIFYTIDFIQDKIVDNCIIIDNEKFPHYSDWVVQRDYTTKLPAHYGKALKIPYVNASENDLEKNFTADMLTRLQTDLHNVLWGGGGTDDNEIFASLTNLILAKVRDENETGQGVPYNFQSLTYAKGNEEDFESNEQLFERINALYRRALKAKLYITSEKELEKSYVIDTKKFSLSKLKYTVQQLERFSFTSAKSSLHGQDILGIFFENIIRNGFKQTKGQFFTHPYIVKFMLWAVQADRLAIKKINEDEELPYIIDPSAGSGTFLIEYMKFITESVTQKYRNQLGTANTIKNKLESWFGSTSNENRWAQDYIYGTEINFNLGTAAKVNMILHGDGSSNIFVKDGLLPFSQYTKERGEKNLLCLNELDLVYEGREVNQQFDLILTNPPFSVELDNDTKKTVTKAFIFGSKKNSENLFIERWYQLLRENGRVAAVLPESVFDTNENKYIRLFLYKYFKIKAVVSLPQLTFEPYTSTKTSILFAQKKTKEEIVIWEKAWTNACKKYSWLKTRVENLINVYEGNKSRSKLTSIKNLSSEEEKEILVTMLSYHFNKQDQILSVQELIDKYQTELTDICTVDKDVNGSLYFINTAWVFGEVAKNIPYSIYMAEVDNIGYKRSKRGEKKMPNELFRQDIDETILVDDGIESTVLDDMRKINWD